jgi:hypothetical protein
LLACDIPKGLWCFCAAVVLVAKASDTLKICHTNQQSTDEEKLRYIFGWTSQSTLGILDSAAQLATPCNLTAQLAKDAFMSLRLFLHNPTFDVLTRVWETVSVVLVFKLWSFANFFRQSSFLDLDFLFGVNFCHFLTSFAKKNLGESLVAQMFSSATYVSTHEYLHCVAQPMFFIFNSLSFGPVGVFCCAVTVPRIHDCKIVGS